MSSSSQGFVRSQLAGAERARYRLHSHIFTLYARAFAVLFLVGVCLVLQHVLTVGAQLSLYELAGTTLFGLVLLAFAGLIWSRPKPVFATESGLEVGAGKKRRLVPWSRVIDVREIPWTRGSLSWHPRMWQVDLDRDERFDFYGTRRAREIVTEYVKQADARAARPALKPE